MSASGLESTIAVAIDQILRLAPSIRPPIEPVVSSTKATSTVGFATAGDRPADSGRVARAKARSGWCDAWHHGSPPVCCPSEPRFPWLRGALRSKTRRATVRICGRLCAGLGIAAGWSQRNRLGLRAWNCPPARSASCRRRTAASRRRRWRSRAAPRGCCARWGFPASANCRCPRGGAPIWWR